MSDASARPKKEKERGKGAGAPRVTARRPTLGHKWLRYLQEVRHELSRTQWPSREEWIRATQVVFGLLIAVGIYIFVLDSALSFVIKGVLGFGR
ncbi:MAG: preprotein translocase subunit SecE [Armatimonadetes bacterium]|nr:preprotein translocase subunit SecE [Armatimonadota bacterium]